MTDYDEYLFAQKDDANSNFKIQLRATKDANQTNFVMALAVAGYNGNTTCDETCGVGKGVQFFKDKYGATIINQFICSSSDHENLIIM